MTLAHLSDTHLGFRAYGKNTPQGVNQREVDVMKSFRLVLDAIAAREPDLVVHAGDLFHQVRPSNMSVVYAFQLVQEFQRKRGHKPFVIIGGNHDTAKTADVGNILRLFAAIPGVHVAPDKLEIFSFPEFDLDVTCIPDNVIRRREDYELVPSGTAKNNVLTLHGVDYELIQHGQGDIDVKETRPDRWTYVALGDYHIHRAYGPNICYSGSTDFASTNIWEESTIPKGWVWFDSEVGRLEWNAVETRPVIDLPRIDALKLEPRDVEKRMLKNADWDPQLQPIIRQRIVNASLGLRGKISQDTIHDLNQRSLFYHLVTTMPAATEPRTAGASRVGKSLEQSWTEHVEQTGVPPEVRREALRTMGLELLEEVASEATTAEA